MAETLSVRNPRTGEFDYEIELTTAATIEKLAAGLSHHQPRWEALGVDARITTLQTWKGELQAASEDIISALQADTGRMSIARGEFFGLIGMIDRWCADAKSLLATTDKPSATLPDVTLSPRYTPYPVLGAISPWNFPLLLSFIDVVPALLAGCAAIVKPSEVTPRFAAPVAKTIERVPELRDVLAFVSGDGRTGAALIEHVDVVAFTGSVATGRKVAEAAARAFIPAFLELGGKDPAIVLEGSDIDRAVTALLRASVSATGQACQSIERIYVNAKQHDEFVDRLSAAAGAVQLSYPDPNEGTIGPLIFARQADIIAAHLDDAIKRGARVHAGGEIFDRNGSKWIAPTVLSHVDHSMQVMTEESFGPLMPVMRFESVDEAIALANDSAYGLSAAVFGPDDASALAVAEKLEAGGISVNDAGMTTMIFEACKSAFNLSGMGPSRMGPTGLTRFLRHKALYINRGAVTGIDNFAES